MTRTIRTVCTAFLELRDFSLVPSQSSAADQELLFHFFYLLHNVERQCTYEERAGTCEKSERSGHPGIAGGRVVLEADSFQVAAEEDHYAKLQWVRC